MLGTSRCRHVHQAFALVGAPRSRWSARGSAPVLHACYWFGSFEPTTRLLPDVCPRAGTVKRALLAVTAGVRAPLLSLTGRAASPGDRRPPSPRERETVTRRPFESCKPETATPSLTGKSNAIGHVPASRREQGELDPNRCDERTCASEDNVSFSPPAPE